MDSVLFRTEKKIGFIYMAEWSYLTEIKQELDNYNTKRGIQIDYPWKAVKASFIWDLFQFRP